MEIPYALALYQHVTGSWNATSEELTLPHISSLHWGSGTFTFKRCAHTVYNEQLNTVNQKAQQLLFSFQKSKQSNFKTTKITETLSPYIL